MPDAAALPTTAGLQPAFPLASAPGYARNMSEANTAGDLEESAYHLGTADDELVRLGYQHQVWQQVTQDLWKSAGFGFGQTLLDLGCGPGFATMELARLAGPAGRVHAIDASQRFIRYLQTCADAGGLTNVAAHTGDVQSLDLKDASIDGAFARWLLCFVAEPQKVCAEVARVLKPGGVFVAWDYLNYRAVGVFPEKPAIQRMFEAYRESALRNGAGYDIGADLPAMLQRCGLDVHRLLPIQRIVPPGTPTWRWVTLFNDNYVPKLVASGGITEAEGHAIHAAWTEAAADPASLFFTPPMLGIVARKPSGQS